jgi:hypothetical protein
VAALVLAALVAVISSAQAAPSNKIYDATVRVISGPVTGNSATLRLTLTNSTRSKQTLGSANFTAGNGITLGTPTATNRPQQWTAVKQGTNIVAFRSTVALKPGEFVFADLAVTTSASCIAAWTTQVKQSNDFSGTGNDFAPGTSSNLRPLGSFVIDDIGTKVDDPATTNVVEDLFVPQLAIPDPPAPVRISAFDVCGAAYPIYGASPSPGAPVTFGTGATLDRADPDTLAGADLSTIAWSSATTGPNVGTGSATVDPVRPASVTETGDQLVVDDQFTNIAATSKEFDVVEKICTVFDDTCHWDNGNNNIHVDAVPPSGGASLGIGFIGDASFSCDGATAAKGRTLVYVNPRDYPVGGTQSVTLTYDKTIPGTSGPVSTFKVCISPDNGENWKGPIDDCSTAPPIIGDAPCVQDRGRSSGNLVIVLFFDPHSDPVGGIK